MAGIDGSGLNSQFGFAKEATPGTYDTPDHFIEFTRENIQLSVERIWSQGIRNGRRMRSAFAAGAKNVAGQTVHELTTDDMGLLWEACIGGTVNTTGVGPYTHTMSAGDLATYTLQFSKSGTGGTAHPFNALGCKVASWQLECSAGELPVLTVDWVGTSMENTTALETASYTSAPTRLAFTHGTLDIASSEIAIDSFSIRGDNGLASYHQLQSTDAGAPVHRESDWREVTAQFTFDFADLTQYNRFVNATGAVAFDLAFTSGTESVTLTGEVEFDGSGPTVDGPEIIKDNAEATFYGSTDANALEVIVVNSDAAP